VLKIEKKQVKIVSVVIAAFFLLGIVGLAVSQTGKTYAAASSNVGIVNYQQVTAQYPEYEKAAQAFNAEVAQAKQDYETKTATMNDQDKQAYYTQTMTRLNMRKQELVGAVDAKVLVVVKAIADARGLTVVVDKSVVIYGGQDITDDVLKKLSGK